MTSILFSIIFALFNNTNLKDKTFIMSFKEHSKLPVFDEIESSNGLLLAKYPLSYVYKHYYDEMEETISSNGKIVKITNTPKNDFDDEQINYRNQDDFFTKKDLDLALKNYQSIVIIKKNKIYFNEICFVMSFDDKSLFKNIEVSYNEPSYLFNYINYETKTGVKVNIVPSFQARIKTDDKIFLF